MRMPPARATIALVIACSVIWAGLSLTGLDGLAAFAAGFVPARLGPAAAAYAQAAAGQGVPLVPLWLTPLTSAFLHANLLHVAFNMMMLGFCGRFVEVAIGTRGLLILYLVGAYAAAAGQYLWQPDDVRTMIGASGATSAVVGAYALLYGQRRATFADRRLAAAANILWLAAAWIGVQALTGVALGREGGAPIAVAAHVGGFLAGLLLAKPLLLLRYRGA